MNTVDDSIFTHCFISAAFLPAGGEILMKFGFPIKEELAFSLKNERSFQRKLFSSNVLCRTAITQTHQSACGTA